MTRTRWVALGVALIVAWAAVRFVLPQLLGWPVVTCSPEPNPPAECPYEARDAGPVWFLLPMTEVRVDGYGQCASTDRIRYLGGFETTINWIC